MSKYKQIDECVDIIVYIMEELPYNYKTEAILRTTLITMSIFISNKDMIDMIKNKVIPKLSDTVHTDYFGFISDQLNKLEDEILQKS